jgi:general secretion pathway protein K
MHDPVGKSRSRESGMALVAVLGFLAALSLVLLAIVIVSRGAVDSTSRHLLRTQAQLATDSALEYAANAIAGARGQPPALLQQPEVLEIAGFRVKVSARPERGKVDLNYADAVLLATLFRSAGATPDQADARAASVEDWRDGDELLRPNGAERRQYASAGRNYGPANRFFGSVGQARFVLGMTREIFACISGELTVLTQAPGIEIRHASPALQRELGIEVQSAETAGTAAPLASADLVTPGDVFEISVEMEDKSRRIRRGERVAVRITGNPEDPYWIIGVEPLFPAREGAAAACPRPARPA